MVLTNKSNLMKHKSLFITTCIIYILSLAACGTGVNDGKAVMQETAADTTEVSLDRLMAPDSELRMVLIANPTQRYQTSAIKTRWLIENMIATGKYETLYLDIPAWMAMIYNDYVNSQNGITLKEVGLIASSHELYMSDSDVMQWLARLKELVSEGKQDRLRVCGLNYTIDEVALGILPSIYKAHTKIMEQFVREWNNPTDDGRQQLVEYIDRNQAELCRDIGEDAYGMYKRAAELKMLDWRQKGISGDAIRLENFMYTQQARPQDSICIIFLGPYEVRMEEGTSSFRKMVEQNFSHQQFLVFNLIDVKAGNIMSAIRSESGGMYVHELADYDRAMHQ